MALNTFQWSSERHGARKQGGNQKNDAISMLNAKLDSITRLLNRTHVDSVSSNVSACEICGDSMHVTIDYQVGLGKFASQDPTHEHVNFVNTFN